MANKLEAEYRDLYNAWREKPDPGTTSTLLRAVDPVLTNAIRSYTPDMLNSPTIRSQARLMAAEAFPTYDANRGSLRSHLLTQLQRLRRRGMEARQIIRMPEQVARDRMLESAAVRELSEQLGRHPSDTEIADYSGLTLQRLQRIRAGAKPIAEGSMSGVGTEEEGALDPAVRNLGAGYSTQLEFAYDDLDPVNKSIMERAFGMHGHPRMSARDIAKHLRVTPAAVSQRMRAIQARIDELEDLGGV